MLILMSINTLISQEIVGKWDLDVEMDKGILPSWLEVKKSGTKALVGYFVAHNGSARPISEVFFHNGIIDFSIPPQFDGLNDLHFQGVAQHHSQTNTSEHLHKQRQNAVIYQMIESF